MSICKTATESPFRIEAGGINLFGLATVLPNAASMKAQRLLCVASSASRERRDVNVIEALALKGPAVWRGWKAAKRLAVALFTLAGEAIEKQVPEEEDDEEGDDDGDSESDLEPDGPVAVMLATVGA